MNRKDIRITLPRKDCRFVEIHNFVDLKGNKLASQYALCRNRYKAQDCYSIDITLKGNPLLWETSCHNCKYYDSSNQLSLFNE